MQNKKQPDQLICTDTDAAGCAKLLLSSDRILLLCHMKPDGDTLGSAFALCHALKKLGKTVRVECSDGFPARYEVLFGDVPVYKQPEFPPEVVVAVDIADTQLLGVQTSRYKDRIDLCIDHHPSNTRYAKQLFLNGQAAATAELVYQVICEMGVSVDRQIANCIYTGLSTDTGCFRYSNTTSYTMRLAADMMDLGIESYAINRRMLEMKSVGRIQLERIVMDTLEYGFNNRYAVIVISRDAVEETGVQEDELDGIAAYPRQIEGVEIAATLRQKGPEEYRISMRCGIPYNASEICGRLGGGGHARAAGCTLRGTLALVKATLFASVKKAFELDG